MSKPIKDFVKGDSFTIQLNYTNGTDLTGSDISISFTSNINNVNSTKTYPFPTVTGSSVDLVVPSSFTSGLDVGENIVALKRVSNGNTTTILRSGLNEVETVNILKSI